MISTSAHKGRVPTTTKSPPRDGHHRGHDPRSKPLSNEQDTRYGCRRGHHKISGGAA